MGDTVTWWTYFAAKWSGLLLSLWPEEAIKPFNYPSDRLQLHYYFLGRPVPLNKKAFWLCGWLYSYLQRVRPKWWILPGWVRFRTRTFSEGIWVHFDIFSAHVSTLFYLLFIKCFCQTPTMGHLTAFLSTLALSFIRCPCFIKYNSAYAGYTGLRLVLFPRSFYSRNRLHCSVDANTHSFPKVPVASF